MRTYLQTVAAVGDPVSRAALDWGGHKLIVARWRNRDFDVKRTADDAFRIALSLSSKPTIHHKQSDFKTSMSPAPGDVILFPPMERFETRLEGDGDVLQVFIEKDAIEPFGASRPIMGPLLNFASEDLRASAVALFLNARSQRAAAMLCDTLRQLVAARGGHDLIRGGLPAAVVQRIIHMIDAKLDAWQTSPLTVGDLAAAARLSVSHFIRAFRHTTGTTPYQYVMTRRRQRAIGLLCRPTTSVAEVADTLGFSSPSHFVESFRRRFGATPGAFRQAVIDDDWLGRHAFEA